MARDLFNRYVWLVDTLKRHGRMTRSEIDACWLRSRYSDGRPLPRRTFYNYRQAIEELFDITVECDQATFEYYISEEDAHSESVTDWLLNSAATNDILSGSRDVAARIFIENVPSAREYLGVVIDALRAGHTLRFNYHPYTRSLPTAGVVIEPYLLKIFKQRWYVTGRNVAEGRIKTYALDRMKEVVVTSDSFKPDPAFDPESYFNDSFGIVVSQNEPKRIVLRVDHRQAKYFRALPLHHSQTEMINDEYSIFHYRLRITDDFVAELLSYGPSITVLEPPELRAIMKTRLTEALKGYE